MMSQTPTPSQLAVRFGTRRGVVQSRVTLETRHPLAGAALSIFGVTRNHHFSNHAPRSALQGLTTSAAAGARYGQNASGLSIMAGLTAGVGSRTADCDMPYTGLTANGLARYSAFSGIRKRFVCAPFFDCINRTDPCGER
jgi:hypothetical protein